MAKDVVELDEFILPVTPPPSPAVNVANESTEKSLLSDPQVAAKAKKIAFSQDKYRRSFEETVHNKFRKDEFVLADTYGPKEYYIVTTFRLLVCDVKSGFFSNSLGDVIQAIDLSDVTRIMTWSELYYGTFDHDYDCPFMAMSLETLKGDVRIEVNAFDSNPGFYKDPHFFGSMIEQAIANIELGEQFVDAELYLAARDDMTR